MLNYDKLLHFIAGFCIALFTYQITYSHKLATYVTLIIAIAKEIYDHISTNHISDFNDIIATLVGGLTYLHLS